MIIRLRFMKRRADKLAERTGEQHFIIKYHGEIIFMTKRELKYCRQKGIIPRTFTATELKKYALYHTK
jgi:hypothetical protein